MRSSAGQHWIALDQVRALAAFMVFSWHFTHAATGYPVTFDGAPAFFPLAILDEGHTGVALFMTLSGYLFAKLLDGRDVDYAMFLWNRFVRLAPLLMVAVLAAELEAYLMTGQANVTAAFVTVAGGFVGFAPLSNGIWSIVVETHFYLLLPLLLTLVRGNRWAPLLLIGLMIAVRIHGAAVSGAGRDFAYWTIIGRLDQFVLGLYAFQHRHLLLGRHRVAAGTALGFLLFYYLFDAAGGWNALPQQGWPGVGWSVLPAVEGAAYALLIAYYDGNYRPATHGVSGFIGRIGAYSYAIYLFHFFTVFRAAAFIDRHVMPLSNFYVAYLWSAACFVAMLPFAYCCHRWIEAPFLRLRQPYARAAASTPPGISAPAAMSASGR